MVHTVDLNCLALRTSRLAMNYSVILGRSVDMADLALLATSDMVLEEE